MQKQIKILNFYILIYLILLSLYTTYRPIIKELCMINYMRIIKICNATSSIYISKLINEIKYTDSELKIIYFKVLSLTFLIYLFKKIATYKAKIIDDEFGDITIKNMLVENITNKQDKDENGYNIIKCSYCVKQIKNTKSFHMFDNVFCSNTCLRNVHSVFKKTKINTTKKYIIVNNCKINLEYFWNT